MVSTELLREKFYVVSGELFRKNGKKVGTKHHSGYLRFNMNKKNYAVHRVIYQLETGVYPDYVDHIDGNKTNNKIENLRDCSFAENKRNVTKYKNNTSGYKNVYFNKRNNNYMVCLTINNKPTYFGSFKDVELADLVAMEARNKYHKEFANHAS